MFRFILAINVQYQFNEITYCPWSHGLRSKDFKLVLWCHELLSKFAANSHLPRVLRKLRLSANDKGDDKMILGTVHRFPGIYLAAKENPGKRLLGDRR